jgi:3-hydroxyisobutyrate dehydrogenase-like beta-hydroxyacid dehydrogenase
MLMVGNDNDLLEVALGKDGALAGMKQGAILVDHTTASPDAARKVFAEAKKKGVDFIDAPVSGRPGGARRTASSR